jgi:hypothetical protein
MFAIAAALGALLHLLAPSRDVAGASEPPRARVVSVESEVARSKLALVDPKEAVRAGLEDELSRIDWRANRAAPVVELRAVVAEAESVASPSGIKARVVVRLALLEPNGKLLGQVSGRASAEDTASNRASLEAAVLDAAARQAALAVPEAARRARSMR